MQESEMIDLILKRVGETQKLVELVAKLSLAKHRKEAAHIKRTIRNQLKRMAQ